ncbi:hypothetical protein [Streptomyces sp. NPDC002573]|uniref:hypothetical protein n=1 Tax=Streptomyces sp. NPDC002573 TaxID=3364651 RepID=UPI0036C6C3A1
MEEQVRDYGFSPAQQDEIWRRWREGQSFSLMGRALGADVFIVERWLTSEDFQVHLAGSNQRIREATEPLWAPPSEIWPVESVPFGDPSKGVIQ